MVGIMPALPQSLDRMRLVWDRSEFTSYRRVAAGPRYCVMPGNDRRARAELHPGQRRGAEGRVPIKFPPLPRAEGGKHLAAEVRCTGDVPLRSENAILARLLPGPARC